MLKDHWGGFQDQPAMILLFRVDDPSRICSFKLGDSGLSLFEAILSQINLILQITDLPCKFSRVQ